MPIIKSPLVFVKPGRLSYPRTTDLGWSTIQGLTHSILDVTLCNFGGFTQYLCPEHRQNQLIGLPDRAIPNIWGENQEKKDSMRIGIKRGDWLRAENLIGWYNISSDDNKLLASVNAYTRVNIISLNENLITTEASTSTPFTSALCSHKLNIVYSCHRTVLQVVI